MDTDLIAIRMRLTGGRQVESEANRGTRAIRGTEAAAKASSASAVTAAGTSSAAFRKQAQMMKATGRTMTYGLTAPLGLIGALSIRTAADFGKSMAQVRTATGLGGKGLAEMEALALKWGAETIFSANDSAEAMLELTKSGIGPAQIKAGALGATMNLAATEGLELAKTAEIVGAAMNTFGIKATKSQRIADALAGGALASSASVGGLALSLSQGGQSAAMYGLSLEETVGTLAAFAQNGIQASDAGTSFKTFLMRLNPTTKKAKELMAELGLDFFDADGKMTSIAETSRILNEQLGDMSDKQRSAALGVLFGTDAIRAANIVYKEGPEGIMRYVRATEKKGAAEKMAEAQMEGLSGAIEEFKGSMETAAVLLGTALAPAVEAMAGGIGGLADQFAALPPEVQTTIAVVAGLAALAGPMLWFAGSMANAVIKIRELRAAEAMGGGFFGGGKGRFMRGLGIAGLGVGAAQMTGGAVGGDLGDLLANAGSGAALGAGIGSIVPGIGTALGAAIGGTGGAALTAVNQLTASEKQLTTQQQRLLSSAKDLSAWMGRQREASRGLVAADQRVQKAHRRARIAADAAKGARRDLGAVIEEYGAKSRPAIRAEARLTILANKHRRAVKALQDAERLRGVALSAYKTATNATVLAERHRINILTRLRDRQARLFQAAKAANPQSERTRTLASQLLSTETKLADAHRKHSQTLADAAAKGGQRYAAFLARAKQESIRAGGFFQAMDQKVRGLTENLRRLSETPVAPQFPGTMTPTRKPGRNAMGTAYWRGGPTWLAENGPELVDLPPGSRVTAAPATRRLFAAVGDPQPSARLAGYDRSDGGRRVLAPIVVKIGRREIANVVVEAEEDAEARL